MASNQPGGRRQGQYRGHTASTGAPDKQTQKGRNIEKHSPWAVRGAPEREPRPPESHVAPWFFLVAGFI